MYLLLIPTTDFFASTMTGSIDYFGTRVSKKKVVLFYKRNVIYCEELKYDTQQLLKAQ